MNIEKLFSTKERIQILEEIIYLDREFGVNEVAKKLRVSKALVSKYFEILVKEKIIKRRKSKFVIENNSNVRSIKIMLNIQKININIFKKYRFIKAAGLYGSLTKGTNIKSSDVDLWVKVGNSKEEELAELASELRKKVRDIKILILDNKKIEKLKKEDPLFYHSLYFSSIVLYGGENEI